MSRGKPNLFIVVIAVVLVVTIAGIFLYPDEPDTPSPATSGNIIHMDLGITYLTISPGISEHNGLDIENGAMITEVVSGSPADQAGIYPGDVILSFNGIQPREQSPLLGMMMTCPPGEPMTLEVWRQGQVKVITFYDESFYDE